jgi:hypothetical protein
MNRYVIIHSMGINPDSVTVISFSVEEALKSSGIPPDCVLHVLREDLQEDLLIFLQNLLL